MGRNAETKARLPSHEANLSANAGQLHKILTRKRIGWYAVTRKQRLAMLQAHATRVPWQLPDNWSVLNLQVS